MLHLLSMQVLLMKWTVDASHAYSLLLDRYSVVQVCCMLFVCPGKCTPNGNVTMTRDGWVKSCAGKTQLMRDQCH